jgi:hypothetical protein
MNMPNNVGERGHYYFTSILLFILTFLLSFLSLINALIFSITFTYNWKVASLSLIEIRTFSILPHCFIQGTILMALEKSTKKRQILLPASHAFSTITLRVTRWSMVET